MNLRSSTKYRMTELHAMLAPYLFLLPTAKAMCVCFFILRAAFEALSARQAATAGVAVGTAVWAQPLLGEPWTSTAGLAPALTLLALIIAVAAVAWSFLVYRRCEAQIAVIGGGAILGGGVALSHTALLLARGAPGIAGFDDVAFANSIAVASGAAVAALAVARARPGRLGQGIGALCLASGGVVSQAAAQSWFGFQANGSFATSVGTVSAAHVCAIAGVWLIGSVMGLQTLSPAKLMTATMAEAAL
jgi:NO-binding membrane sensor protein with MHYT domain